MKLGYSQSLDNNSLKIMDGDKIKIFGNFNPSSGLIEIKNSHKVFKSKGVLSLS